MRRRFFCIFIIFLLLIMILYAPSNVLADTEAESIIKKADEPFVSAKIYSIATITLFKNGKARTPMEMENYSMSKKGKYYSLTVYKKPTRLKGTAYLVIDNDVWVRFASTGRVKKYSSFATGNYTGGSDFSYNDMGESGRSLVENYNSKLLSNRTKIDGRICYKIELTPKKKKQTGSYYEKMLVFIDRENYHYLRIDYYKNGANIKSLFFSDYRRVDGKDYPFKLTMKNHIKPTKTEIITEKIELNSSKVKESLFTPAYLKGIK